MEGRKLKLRDLKGARRLTLTVVAGKAELAACPGLFASSKKNSNPFFIERSLALFPHLNKIARPALSRDL